MPPLIADTSWILKILISAVLIAPFTTFIVFFNKQFGMRPEVFYVAWVLGNIIAFLVFAHMSGVIGTFSALLVPFLAAMALGICIGGTANLLYVQAVPHAPNPGLPLAFFSINIPLAYILSYSVSKILPNQLPHVEFNWMNFAGILIVVIGIAMIACRPR